MGDHMGFTIVLRGYDRGEVDAMVERIRSALASSSHALRSSLRSELTRPAFRVTFRGYDRFEVDDYLRQAIDRLA
jgi:DivIVA domain-containing protein